MVAKRLIYVTIHLLLLIAAPTISVGGNTPRDTTYRESKPCPELKTRGKNEAWIVSRPDFFVIHIPKNPLPVAIAIATTLFMGIVVLSVYSRTKQIKYKTRNMELEQQLLISQMNPHFVFNSLTAIQSYIFRKDPHQAGKYLASFAKLVRLILENSRSEIATIDKEVKTLEYYLELQSMRFEDKFDYEIVVDSEIFRDEMGVPPMLAQPLIENAIEHGISHIQEKGLITIRFSLQGKNIILEVEDNGIGINESIRIQKEKGKKYQSLATNITTDRLKKLRQAKGYKIDLTIIDKSERNSNERGTLVKLTIPYKYA